MRKLIKSVSLSILLGVAFIGAAWAQTFNAAVNRTEVPQGETFVLTLELADGSDSGNPDLSVLDKDFIVYLSATLSVIITLTALPPSLASGRLP